MNITKRNFWLLGLHAFLFIFSIFETKAQEKHTIQLIVSDQDRAVLDKYFSKKLYADSLEAFKISQEIVQVFRNKGYLTAGVDSVKYVDKNIHLHLWIGDQFQWAKLSPGNINESLLSHSGYSPKYFNNKIFHYPEVSQLFDKIIKYSENHGYPFASVSLDSIAVSGNQINATLNYNEGPFISFDSLIIHGSSKIKKRFLADYLKIVAGQPFEERNYQEIAFKIKRLPYLQLTEAPQVTFQNNEATVHLTLEDKKINQIDGIIGFFPNAGNDDKLMLTGQFNIWLQNMFGSGKALHLEWQKLKPLSQLLDISYFHPNILSSPINFGTSFHLLKEDTTFLNRDAGLVFSINKGLYSDIRLFTKIRSSNLLSTDQFKNQVILPDYADFVLNTYGIGYQWRNLDDFFFPTRGVLFEIDGAIGNKKIRKNGSLPQEMYTGVNERSLQVNFSSGFSHYSSIKKNFVLLSRIRAGIIDNDQLFLNDLFRIGGLHTLRGFNENFFFAQQYMTATCEVRMMLDRQSFFMLFADQGILKYNLTNNNFSDRPTGLGLGLNMALEGGIFNFVYAMGSSKAQSINFQSSKIHFGYISRF